MNIHIKYSLITLLVAIFVICLAKWTSVTMFALIVVVCLSAVYGMAYAIIEEEKK